MIEDKNGKILKANKTMEKITGYSKEKLLNNTVFETVVPENQEEIARKNIEKILDKNSNKNRINNNFSKNSSNQRKKTEKLNNNIFYT